MLTLPSNYHNLIQPFAPVFSKRLWPVVQVLLIGAILTPGQRTVAAVLRIMGLSQDKHFQNYHRVLNRAVWSSYQLSRILLGLLVMTFVPTGPIIWGLDDTIERRLLFHTRQGTRPAPTARCWRGWPGRVLVSG